MYCWTLKVAAISFLGILWDYREVLLYFVLRNCRLWKTTVFDIAIVTDLIWGQRVSGELWTHIFVSLEFRLRHWQAVIWGKYRRRFKFLNTVTGKMQQVWPYKLYKRKLYLSIYPTTALWNLEKKTEIWDKLSAQSGNFIASTQLLTTAEF